MPTNRHRLLLVYRRRVLVDSFVPSPLMRVCKNCEKSYTPEKYKLGGASGRCIECARKGRSCNLTPFSPSTWARIRQQKKEKSAEAKEALARFTRLQAEVTALESKELELVEGELKNIEEVEADEKV